MTTVDPAADLSQGAPDQEDALEAVASCLLCGETERKVRFEEPPYSVVDCTQCGLTYVTPRRNPDRLAEIYQTAYWHSPIAKDFGYTDYQKDAELYRRTYRRRYKLVARHFARPGRVLDVGCAAGFFLSVMKEKGWQTSGVEISDYIANHGREKYGLDDVRTGTLDAAGFEPNTFDLITFWDVVEHLVDPVEILASARTLLKDGGRIVIETQNVNSAFARVMGKRWQHYKHHEHLYHFNPRTVASLAKNAGLEVIENRASLGGKYVSFGFITERANRVSPLLAKILFPLRMIARKAVYVNPFDEMIVVCKKA